MGNVEVQCCKCDAAKDELALEPYAMFSACDEGFPEPQFGVPVGHLGGVGDDYFSAGLKDLLLQDDGVEEPPRGVYEQEVISEGSNNDDLPARIASCLDAALESGVLAATLQAKAVIASCLDAVLKSSEFAAALQLKADEDVSHEEGIQRISRNWRNSKRASRRESREVLTLRLENAGGAHSRLNGIYVQSDEYEQRPKFKQIQGDAVIYFKSPRWNLSETDTTEGGCYLGRLKDDDAVPPEGEWIGQTGNRPPTLTMMDASERQRLSVADALFASLMSQMSALGHDSEELEDLQYEKFEADELLRDAQEREFSPCIMTATD